MKTHIKFSKDVDVKKIKSLIAKVKAEAKQCTKTPEQLKQFLNTNKEQIEVARKRLTGKSKENFETLLEYLKYEANKNVSNYNESILVGVSATLMFINLIFAGAVPVVPGVVLAITTFLAIAVAKL